MDRPHPVSGDAVRVMTVHQAKGLEFSIVVLWDARASWSERATNDPWVVDRDSGGWALQLDGLRWEEPPGQELAARERRMREAERTRLAYVAATRARDLLVVPHFPGSEDWWILPRLLGGCDHPAVSVRPLHGPQAPADWYVAAEPPARPVITHTDRDRSIQAAWVDRARTSCHPDLRPSPFTQAATPRMLRGSEGRFGRRFGEVVHAAIGHVLEDGNTAETAVDRAADSAGLQRHRAHAIADVERTVATLAELGIRHMDPSSWRLEYPIAGRSGADELVAGYVDLVAVVPHARLVLDFKTDEPPSAAAEIAPAYLTQVLGARCRLGRSDGPDRGRGDSRDPR
jgi:ATP-dependent helicase/nuclease subunit A